MRPSPAGLASLLFIITIQMSNRRCWRGTYIFYLVLVGAEWYLDPGARPSEAEPIPSTARPQPGPTASQMLLLADRGRRLDLPWSWPRLFRSRKLWNCAHNLERAVDNMKNDAFVISRCLTCPNYSMLRQLCYSGAGNASSSFVIFSDVLLDIPRGVRDDWRARTFDTYRDGQWFSNIDIGHDFDPESDVLLAPAAIGRWEGVS